MSLTEQFNIGARIKSVPTIATVITQTSATLATTQDGVTVDRNAAGLRRYYSCKVCVGGLLLYAASSAHTATIPSLNFQHSSDGTSWDNYSTATVPAAVTWGASSSGYAGLTTAGTEQKSIEMSVNLNGARRYIRCQIAPATFTDSSSGSTLSIAGLIVFGGADELPAQ